MDFKGLKGQLGKYSVLKGTSFTEINDASEVLDCTVLTENEAYRRQRSCLLQGIILQGKKHLSSAE
jgi:hypothetical protein